MSFDYIEIGDHGAAQTTLGILAVSNLLQACSTAMMGQGIFPTAIALVGGKPLWDAYLVTGAGPVAVTKSAGLSPIFMFTCTRLIDTLADALPQLLYQAKMILSIPDTDRTYAMWGSIVGSALSIAYMACTSEIEADMSRYWRKTLGLVHGYLDETNFFRRAMCTGGILLMVGGSLLSKSIALSCLATASFTVTVCWLTVEGFVLLGLRMLVEGEWRFHIVPADGFVASMAFSAVLYVATLGCPFPLLRFPGE